MSTILSVAKQHQSGRVYKRHQTSKASSLGQRMARKWRLQIGDRWSWKGIWTSKSTCISQDQLLILLSHPKRVNWIKERCKTNSPTAHPLSKHSERSGNILKTSPGCYSYLATDKLQLSRSTMKKTHLLISTRWTMKHYITTAKLTQLRRIIITLIQHRLIILSNLTIQSN